MARIYTSLEKKLDDINLVVVSGIKEAGPTSLLKITRSERDKGTNTSGYGVKRVEYSLLQWGFVPWSPHLPCGMKGVSWQEGYDE